MYTVYLLFPLTRGIISNDFSHVRSLRGIHTIVEHYPSLFDTSIKLFILLVVWIYLITIIKNVFNYFAKLSIQTQAKIATVRLRQMLLEKCMGFGKDFYDKNTIAYLQTLLTKSSLLIETRLKLFQDFFTEILLIAAYILIMVHISWKLTVVAGIIFPLVTLITQAIVKKVQAASLEQGRLTTNLNNKIFNILHCMPVIKSFSKEQEEMRSFSEISAEEIEHSFKVQRLTSLVRPIEDVGAMTTNLFIAFAMAMVMQSDHGLSASNAFVFFYLALKTVPGLNAFNRFRLGLANSAVSLEDMEKILNDGESFVVKGGEKEFSGIQEGIEFRNLTFTYPGQKFPTLEGVNFFIPKRSIVAIVGPSGSGKSTLVNLLLRFYDCPSQSIYIDHQDIREYTIPSLRRHMGLVSQDVLLFNDTIRKNILYGASEETPDTDLKDLMQRIHIHDFIEKMPNKYESSVGERGSRLSGGERQRIAVARAIIKDSDILIMDEATSALDSQAETSMSDGILGMAREKTIVIIAHRLSTIKKADKIVYLERGRVAETGSLQELLDLKGLFYKQWIAQKL
jgi:subfamily B ATP-binding cassette protein MsbA